MSIVNKDTSKELTQSAYFCLGHIIILSEQTVRIGAIWVLSRSVAIEMTNYPDENVQGYS